jgi:subtilisin family serine protease
MTPSTASRIALVALLFATLAANAPSVRAGERDQDKEDPRSVPVKTLDDAVKTGRIPREAVAAAQKDGTAAVLVKLKLPEPFRPEGTLDERHVEIQRRAIAKAQSIVAEQISSSKHADLKNYGTIPWIALWADLDTLTHLVGSASVHRIVVDDVEAFHLGTSIPQIFGDIVRQSLVTPGAGQTVAIIDSGVDGSHPFLAGKVVSEACFSTGGAFAGSDSVCPGGNDTTAAGSGGPCGITNCGHGTHVAGIATAGSDGTTFGVAPAANIISVQVSSDFGGTAGPRTSDVLQGLERVYELRNTFQIAAVNLSLGGDFYTDQAECDDDHESRKNVIDNLRAVGIATVASSGNGANPFRSGISAPACISSVISVGATMATGAAESPGIWAFGATQTGSLLDLLAPGTAITSSLPGASTGTMTGTSMAAPHVTGAIAVLRGERPLASVSTILNALATTGVPIADSRPTTTITRPRIRLDLAVEALTQSPLPPSGLQVDEDLGTWLAVSWTDNSQSESQFVVTARPPLSTQLPPRQGTALAGVTSAIVGTETTADGTILKLTPNTDYTLTVSACNAAGKCGESQPITERTLDILPDEPDNLHISGHSASGVILNWSTSYPATSVKLVYYVCGTGYDCDPTTAPITLYGNESFDVSGLIGNWLVHWRVQACSADGCSGWVDGPSAATPNPGAAPVAPANLHLCGSSGDLSEVCLANRITLIWDDIAGNEDRYEFESTIAQQGTPPWNATWNAVQLGSDRESYSLTSWTSGLLYYFRVRACNIYGCSLYSNTISSTAP